MIRSVARRNFILTLFAVFFCVIVCNAQGPDSIYRLPKGTKITLEMASEINSGSASVDDTFIARTAEPVVVRDVVVLPKGVAFEGRVDRVARPARGSRSGELEIVIQRLLVDDGIRRSVSARTVTVIRAESDRTRNVAGIIGSAAFGALIGNAIKPGIGAIVGASVAAGVGGGTLAIRKGRDLRLREGRQFVIELTEELLLPLPDN